MDYTMSYLFRVCDIRWAGLFPNHPNDLDFECNYLIRESLEYDFFTRMALGEQSR